MLRRALALLLLLGGGPLPLRAQSDSAWTRAYRYIEAFLQEQQRIEGTPGIMVAVVQRDSVVFERGVGVADLGTGAPLTGETRFLVGSISKVFTAIALLQLQEEGLVDLDRPVVTYLPWFQVRSPYAPITLRHLLTHTAGLPRDRSDLPSSPYTAVALRDRELTAPPGERFAYSNIGYQLLSLVVEEVEGRPFGEAIRARVLEPLGLRHTETAVLPEGQLGAATGYQYLYDDRPPAPDARLVAVPWTEYTAGDANIVSTADDLGRLLVALLAQGRAGHPPLLQPASFARMVQRTVPATELGPGFFYGFGLVLGQQDDDPILWHGGGMPGYRAIIMGDLDERLGVVVLMNGPGNPRRVAEYALRALVNTRHGAPPPPVPIATDPTTVGDAARFVGTFRDTAGREIRIGADGNRLWLWDGTARIPLVRLDDTSFLPGDTAWNRFPLRFELDSGVAVSVVHGGAWFRGERYHGPTHYSAPGEWRAYVGHYRAQVPYYSNYRVILRRDRLLLVTPEGYEEPLDPVAHREFRIGHDPRSPERVRFGEIVSGRALRLNLSGTDYYRTTRP